MVNSNGGWFNSMSDLDEEVRKLGLWKLGKHGTNWGFSAGVMEDSKDTERTGVRRWE